MFDQGAFDDTSLDDHARSADGSVAPGVGPSVRTEGRVVGIDQGMFRGNDANWVFAITASVRAGHGTTVSLAPERLLPASIWIGLRKFVFLRQDMFEFL